MNDITYESQAAAERNRHVSVVLEEKTEYEGKINGNSSNIDEVNILRIENRICSISRQDLADILLELNEDVCLSKEDMQKRLKELCITSEYAKKLLLKRNMKIKCPYKYIFVIDFEATCCDDSKQFYPHEIIEFPAVLIDTDQLKILDTFHAYVKPLMNPQLSDFCMSLTGISQETVDKSKPFDKVFDAYCQWMNKYAESRETYAILTDGPYDLERFLVLQCIMSQIQFPSFGKCWINIKKLFSASYKVKKSSITNMLMYLGMKFEGKLHSGKDDAYNISRLVITMLQDGVSLKINEYLASYRTKQHRRLLASHIKRENCAIKTAAQRPSKPQKTKECFGANASVLDEAMSDMSSKFEVDPTLVNSELILHKHKMEKRRFD